MADRVRVRNGPHVSLSSLSPRRLRMRLVRLTPGAVGLVAVGGFFGAAARNAIDQEIFSPRVGFPTATFVVNLAGAFLLGTLLETLVLLGDDLGTRRRVRLLAGTGFLGAFTTYSTFAVEADLLVHYGRAGTAAIYVAVSVIGGIGACTVGLILAAKRGRTSKSLPIDPDVDAEGGIQ